MRRERQFLENEAQVVAVLFPQLLYVLVAGRAIGTLKIRILNQGVSGVFFAADPRLVIDGGLERVLEGVLVSLLRSLLGFLLHAGLLFLGCLVNELVDGLLVGLDRLDQYAGVLLQRFLELVAGDIPGVDDSSAGKNGDGKCD